MTARLPTVVLISGRGSNMRVLAEHAAQAKLSIDIRAVFSDRDTAQGLQLANQLGIATHALSPKDFKDRESFDSALAMQVEKYSPRLIVLAGYMRILSHAFVQQFSGRLLNIHPSLLPKYPGLHTHRRALAGGDKIHGASVHFVTEELDGGPVIVQGCVPIHTGDTEVTLHERVQKIEHVIYPQAVDWFAQNRLTLRNGMAWLDNKPLLEPVELSLATLSI